MDIPIPWLPLLILGFVAVIVFGFLYAKWPSFKSGGPFREEVERQRRLREEHENETRD